MTPEQFAEFLNFMKENNSWGENMYRVCCELKRVAYKYVDATWDSRSNTVFSITLRASGGTDGKTFSVTTPEEIKSLYEYLNRNHSTF